MVHQMTHIRADVLDSIDALNHASVVEKMSWASARQTTRVEDTAYCLLGIFGINMPLLYGEGQRAFEWLQREILRTTTELTKLACMPGSVRMFPLVNESGHCKLLPAMCRSVREFRVCLIECIAESSLGEQPDIQS